MNPKIAKAVPNSLFKIFTHYCFVATATLLMYGLWGSVGRRAEKKRKEKNSLCFLLHTEPFHPKIKNVWREPIQVFLCYVRSDYVSQRHVLSYVKVMRSQ